MNVPNGWEAHFFKAGFDQNNKGFCVNLGAAKSLKHFVIQSVSEESREHKVDATEILPPFGRLNDTKEDFSENSNEYCP